MSSFKASLVNFMIRKNHLFRGQLKKEVYDMKTSIDAFRERCEKGAERYARIPEDVSIIRLNIGGIPAEWIVPAGAPAEKVILYTHGGGYVSGSCSDHRAFVSKFAKNAGFKTLLFEYRLAPEHPFPAAVEDSMAVYAWLQDNGLDPKNILIAGESAGGGLCLALLLAIKDKNLEMPAAAVAISPWTDLSCSSDSYTTQNRRSPAPMNSWFVFSKHYAGEHSVQNPWISPLFGDLKGLPPLFINSGDSDELYEDGEKFHRKAVEAGVASSFRRGKGMLHCYPLLAPMFPEATEAMNEIVAFVRGKLAS